MQKTNYWKMRGILLSDFRLLLIRNSIQIILNVHFVRMFSILPARGLSRTMENHFAAHVT
jgi:hypothetical protein